MPQVPQNSLSKTANCFPMIITTDFISRCLQRPSRTKLLVALRSLSLRNFSISLIAIAFLCTPQLALAEGATIQSAKLEATEDGYQLNAQIELSLTAAMEEAVRKGVPLYFTVEFELSRSRWYWLDQVIVRERRDRRVAFAPLTDQYRITVAGLSQNVASFDDVKRVLSRVRSWNVIDKGRLTPGEKYEAAVRFRLDTAQLPKPFQLNVLASKEWSLASDWYRWPIIGGENRP